MGATVMESPVCTPMGSMLSLIHIFGFQRPGERGNGLPVFVAQGGEDDGGRHFPGQAAFNADAPVVFFKENLKPGFQLPPGKDAVLFKQGHILFTVSYTHLDVYKRQEQILGVPGAGRRFRVVLQAEYGKRVYADLERIVALAAAGRAVDLSLIHILKNTMTALHTLVNEKNVALFEKYGV